MGLAVESNTEKPTTESCQTVTFGAIIIVIMIIPTFRVWDLRGFDQAFKHWSSTPDQGPGPTAMASSIRPGCVRDNHVTVPRPPGFA